MIEKETSKHFNQTNFQGYGLDVHKIVFPVVTIIVLAFVVITLLSPQTAGNAFIELRLWLTSQFDWVFIITTNILLLFCMLITVSPAGNIRLGGEDSSPEFSRISWFAMLFAAGLGIGLMFYGVYEPINHFFSPPLNTDTANTEIARDIAMSASIMHWTLHPWALYSFVGLALAFFSYNRKLPLSIRSAFYPILGGRIWGWGGHAIDILALFATIFGIATSLGIGAEQSMAGINYLFGYELNVTNKVIVIVLITMVALASVLRGLDGGIKRLSELNIFLAICLCSFIFLVGPTIQILTNAFNYSLSFLSNLPALSNWIDRTDTDFLHGWTVFYWAWWISWSPFVGMFIARVSKGRTIKEFIFGTIFIPSLISILWLTLFGDNAINQYLVNGNTAVIQTIQNQVPEMSIYKFLEAFPFSQITSFIAITLVCIFFITSMDSGALVIDTIASSGKLDTPILQRILWCIFIGLIAIALTLSGGLSSLQAMALATAFPFCFILLLMCISIIMGLKKELHKS